MITGGGLAWWHAWLCVWIGYFVAAVFICLTGRIGAVYHISFPVVARSSFGIWGSLWPVFNRAGNYNPLFFDYWNPLLSRPFSNGLHMVWSAVLHWRSVRDIDDQIYRE